MVFVVSQSFMQRHLYFRGRLQYCGYATKPNLYQFYFEVA
jgi:hypothetical protein